MRRALFLLLPLLLAACAGTGTHGVNADHAQQSAPPLLGTVDSVTPVDLPNEGGSAGAMIGGTAGAVVGANTGEGRGRYATTILGGVLGSLAGDALQNSGTHPGVEIWVRLDNGKSTVVRQSLNKHDIFEIGDRVQVVNDKAGAHVAHLPPAGKP